MHYADATTSLWYWVQDGRNVSMEFRPSNPGEEALIQSVRPVTGRQVAVSIAEGQLAARLLPEIASTNEGGLVQHAFGSNGRTQAVCIDQPVERCYFPVAPYSSLDPERAKLIVAGAPSPGDPVATGDAVFGWVPASLVDQLAPGVTVIPAGETGAFLFGRLTPASPCAVGLKMAEGGLECISTQNPQLDRFAEVTNNYGQRTSGEDDGIETADRGPRCGDLVAGQEVVGTDCLGARDMDRRERWRSEPCQIDGTIGDVVDLLAQHCSLQGDAHRDQHVRPKQDANVAILKMEPVPFAPPLDVTP